MTSSSYTYDELSRLSRGTYSTNSLLYSYDAMGNRTSVVVANIGSGVQLVSSNATLASTAPPVTIVKALGTTDIAITLPDASAVVGSSFTIKRDTSAGRSWSFVRTNNATSLAAGNRLNGCIRADGAYYFQVSSSAGPTPTLYKLNTGSWGVEQSVIIASIGADTITDLILSVDGSKLYMVVSNSTASYVRVYLTSNFSLSSTIAMAGSTSTGAACLSSDGTKLFVVTNLGIVSVLLSTGAVSTFVSNTSLSKQGICATSNYLFVGNTSSNVLAYNASSGSLSATISTGTTGTMACLTYDQVNNKVWGISAGSANASVLLVLDPSGLTLLYSAQFNYLYTNSLLPPPRLTIDTDNNYVYVGAAKSIYVFDATVAGGIAKLVNAVRGPQTSLSSPASQWVPMLYLGNSRILAKEAGNSTNTAWQIVDASQTNGNVAVSVTGQGGQLINGASTVTLYRPNDSITAIAYQDPTTSAYGWALEHKNIHAPQDLSVLSLPKYQQQDFANELMVVQLTDGQLVGWGDNTGGALCNGQTAGVSPPAPVLFDPTSTPDVNATIVDWALTSYNLYVVFSDGTVYGGGQNATGQLGNGTTTASIYLRRIFGLPSTANRVWAAGASAANNGSVFFGTSDNKLYGCGLNGNGQLGIGSTTNATSVTLVSLASGTINDVVIGSSNGVYWAMVIVGGALYVSGFNGEGQLGLGNTTQQTTFQPVTISGVGSIVHARTIGNYNGTTRWGSSMVLDNNGKIFTSGSNNVGQLGIGSTTAQTSFQAATPSAQLGVTPKFVDCGWVNGLDPVGWALTAVGTLWTWGYSGTHATYETATTNKTSPSIPDGSGNPMQNVVMAVGAAVSTNANDAQLLTLCVDGEIKCGGVLNGMFGTSDPYISAINLIPTPSQLSYPQNQIVKLFMHGTTSTQRLFVLTKTGKLYVLGSNTNAICTGGVAYSTTNTQAMWQQVDFGQFKR